MATVQDRPGGGSGLNGPQQGACSGPEAPAHAPCSAGRDADLCVIRRSAKPPTVRRTRCERSRSPSMEPLPRWLDADAGAGTGTGPDQAARRGMNPMDRALASGAWKPMPATMPMVLGADGAGVVEQRGPGASRFSASNDLFGQLLIAPLQSQETCAEYVAVTEDAPLARVPGGLDDSVAAARSDGWWRRARPGRPARAARQDGADGRVRAAASVPSPPSSPRTPGRV